MDENEKTTAAAENETEVKAGEAAKKSAEEPAKVEDKSASKSTETAAKPEERPAEKTFTQKEMDEIISERLKRERKNSEKANGETEKTARENAALKNSLACYKAGVREDCIEDAVTLAERLMDDKTDFGAALKKVLEKHPSFVSGGLTTGVKTENKSYSQSDEKLRAAFGLKPKN